MPARLANFVFLVETRFLHVGRAGLELLTVIRPPQPPKVLRHTSFLQQLLFCTGENGGSEIH